MKFLKALFLSIVVFAHGNLHAELKPPRIHSSDYLRNDVVMLQCKYTKRVHHDDSQEELRTTRYADCSVTVTKRDKTPATYTIEVYFCTTEHSRPVILERQEETVEMKRGDKFDKSFRSSNITQTQQIRTHTATSSVFNGYGFEQTINVIKTKGPKEGANLKGAVVRILNEEGDVLKLWSSQDGWRRYFKNAEIDIP